MSKGLSKAVSETASLTLSSSVESFQFLHSWVWTLEILLQPVLVFTPVHYMQFYTWLLTKTAPLVSSVRFLMQTPSDIAEFHFLSSSPRIFPCLPPIKTSCCHKLAFISPIPCKGWPVFGLLSLDTASTICGWVPEVAKGCENRELWDSEHQI